MTECCWLFQGQQGDPGFEGRSGIPGTLGERGDRGDIGENEMPSLLPARKKLALSLRHSKLKYRLTSHICADSSVHRKTYALCWNVNDIVLILS